MATPHPGKWERVLNQTQCLLSTIETAVHACILVNPAVQKRWKVVLFFAGQGQLENLKSAVWNPFATNPVSIQDIPEWPVQPNPDPRLFCSGHAMMPDGRLLVAGGEIINPAPPPAPPLGLPYTYIFNGVSEEWEIPGLPGPPHAMAKGRYYPTITTLGAGQGGQGYDKILAMSGLDEDGNYNKIPEIYNPSPIGGGWNQITDDEALQPFEENYPGSHVIPFGPRKGKIFYTIPMLQAYTFNPFTNIEEEPFWVPIASARTTDRHGGNSILLPLLPGSTSAKVLITCGVYTANNSAEIIDLSDTTPVWGSVQNMFITRRNANAVILPDDRILIIGGNREDRHIDPRFTPEVFDPSTGEWTLLPAMNIERSYHSVALLLPDGSVWVSGTTHPPGITNWQHNIELYSPGYLFEGERPKITACPENIIYGNQFSINTDMPIANIRLIRFGSMTHSTDTDQRSVGLSFTAGLGINQWDVTAPADADIAPPGLYMLFVLRAKNQSLAGETATPSVAYIVRVTSQS